MILRGLSRLVLCGVALCYSIAAHAGPTNAAFSVSQFPIGFYVPDASLNRGAFNGDYYVAVAPYGDANDDNLAFTSYTGSASYFTPTSNTDGTYSTSVGAATTLAFANLPFSTDAYNTGAPLPDGSRPGTWAGQDLGVALQFFAPQQGPGCFDYQLGCAANAVAGYMTSAPAVSRPDPTNTPDVFNVSLYIPGGTLTFQFTLLGVDPNTVGSAYTNDNTVNNNSTVVLAGAILSTAPTVEVIWDSSSFVATETNSSPVAPPGAPVIRTVTPPSFIQSSEQPLDSSVPEPATLLLLGSGLLLASRRLRRARP